MYGPLWWPCKGNYVKSKVFPRVRPGPEGPLWLRLTPNNWSRKVKQLPHETKTRQPPPKITSTFTTLKTPLKHPLSTKKQKPPCSRSLTLRTTLPLPWKRALTKLVPRFVPPKRQQQKVKKLVRSWTVKTQRWRPPIVYPLNRLAPCTSGGPPMVPVLLDPGIVPWTNT